MQTVNVIGAGLAGSEATYQLIKRGIKVNLWEMRPFKMTEAHQTGLFSELICSNSFRAAHVENAIGLLKEEMRRLDSLIMRAADANQVEAGGALAVDRTLFSQAITKVLSNHPLVSIINQEVTSIPEGPTIIASGPLTSISLSEAIKDFVNEDYLYFYDAIAPIVYIDSVNKEKVYLKSRYDKGEAAYYNCPLSKEEFDVFYEELIHAKRVVPHDFEMKIFEGCMAIEDMADRGKETLLFGPMKPVGLRHPVTLQTPYAVVQLRQDDAAKTLYNLVGFQTHLTFSEQKRILQLIPGLEKCEIARYGVMHRNTFINAPKVLNSYYQTQKRRDLFFAGQITGVEGYLESASSGMMAGINMARYLIKEALIDFTSQTAIGSLANYIATPNAFFQPMNVTFGLFEPLKEGLRKKERKQNYANRSLAIIDKWVGII
ncbi:MAG: methylenetetrahydrofolate--tRNA-(uracil(54)-C(5))-methyltransferase (FADH(2)-oxidizing) TrmFO [Bacilli bacterium]